MAIIASLLINFIVQLAVIPIPYGISGGLVAFVASMVLFIGVSLVTPERKPDKDIDALMDI